ncbi:SDR family oxidoreductase [Thermoflavimicrobium dichotomicum]|uniref:Uncharacterized conserved protein YbjT, contains NAD(P)-binding and DUF2867 domains n=1 Tax=Thermoflavimicrobium dichotomicum TaxID=46223 RepID=A0A1I3LWD2_9BACL|nr:SDR family oxidoreductase [Thermoflavimicrobium dichotomicum]SFI89074.1 Uncharacterized conserved protein YbjT, contains NAD(P)-binding and DUF2867 domains [Thermoflavimicrobium dichotomicum]
MKVLVAGANGHTGRLIVELLGKSHHHEAYAMIRDRAQAEKLKQLGAKETVLADLEKDVSHAVKGMDAVIFAAGSGSKTGPDKTITVDQEGAKRLIDVAKKEGIAHFVMLSSYGSGDPYALPNLAHYLKAKGEADQYLIASGLTYTIIRPGYLSFEPPTGKVEIAKHFVSIEGRGIPRADVAQVIVSCLDIENAKNKTFELLSGNQAIQDALKAL